MNEQDDCDPDYEIVFAEHTHTLLSFNRERMIAVEGINQV
jgi:hypothetical protein